MTSLYFVRHAQPDYTSGSDSTYPLSEEGLSDRMDAYNILRNIRFDAAVSSPYARAVLTIEPIVCEQALELITDDRLREREKGQSGNSTAEMFRKRWQDFNFCEKGGESLSHTQNRNVEAVKELLKKYRDKTILIGTHGTALSTIINYYDKSFHYDDFMRIIDYMPWVVRMDFDGSDYIDRQELAFVKKDYHGKTN